MALGVHAVHEQAVSEINRLRSNLDQVQTGSLAGRCEQLEAVTASIGEATAALTRDIETAHTKLGQEILKNSGELASLMAAYQTLEKMVLAAGTSAAEPVSGAGVADPWARSRAKGLARHHIGSPLSKKPDGDEDGEAEEEDEGDVDYSKHKLKDVYDEQWAANKDNKYTDKSPQEWYETTRSYLIGRNPVLDVILKWVEQQKDRSILKKETSNLRSELGLMCDVEPQQASEGLWSLLSLNTVCTELRESFLNVPNLNAGR